MSSKLTAAFVLALCLAAKPAAAAWSCGSGGELGEQVQIEFEGSVIYVTTPDDYVESRAWPVIFGLHGDEGDPANSVNYFWRDVPDGRFIFVAPKAPNASGSWYEVQTDNEAWMDRLLATITGAYNVDLDRVYIWGLSGGAVFTSRYIMTRQDVYAAAEMNMGGNGRSYTAPPAPECKIPARFVVSTTDFLREQALSFYDLLTAEGHETVWVDADCQDHCWDEVQAGVVARDWLLDHTLCGAAPDPGASCDGTGGSGTGGSGTGGSSTGGNGAGGSSGAETGGSPGSGGSSAGGSATGGSGGTGATSGNGPGGGAGSGSSNPGTAGTSGDDPGNSLEPAEQEAGCGCRTVATSGTSRATLILPALAWLAWRRRDRRRAPRI
jgi:hypothetical protein